MNLDIPKKIGNFGVLTIPMDFLPLDQAGIRKDWPNLYWRAGQRILSAARYIGANPLLDAVYIGNFSCGPDSFILKFFEEEMAGKSYLHLELDAHSADAGALTRCEAFLDSIKNRNELCVMNNGLKHKNRSRITHHALPSSDSSPIKHDTSRTVYIPHMSDHAFAVAAAFSYCGKGAEVLPESCQESVDLGRKFVSGKECYPCAVTTGDMVKKALEPGFDPARSAFFMPSGTGPCRFGQYNIFHRQVIRDLGMEDLPVFSPNQDEHFYENLDLFGKGYSMRVWEGVVSICLLRKCLLETRPYEKEKGITDTIYQQHLLKLCRTLSAKNGTIEDPYLTAILLSSVSGLLVILLIPDENKKAVKWISAVFSGLTLVFAVAVFVQYDTARGGLQFVERAAWVPSLGIQYLNAVDGFSLPMVLLTGIVFFTGVLTMWELGHRVKEFYAFYFLLVTGFFGLFMSLDLFFIFIWYDVSLFPMYPLIAIWGSTRKKYGAMKLTLTCSPVAPSSCRRSSSCMCRRAAAPTISRPLESSAILLNWSICASTLESSA